MENILIVLILLVLIGGASVYLIRAKRSGVKCIGCPAGGTCSGNQKVRRKKLKNLIIAQKTIYISGMHCAHCVKSVTESLNQIEGVSAEVNLEKGIAHVLMDRDVKDEALIKAVKKEGFMVSSITN